MRQWELQLVWGWGRTFCVPHQCHCGSQIDTRRLHSFVCKRAPSRSAKHHALNDLVARSFASAGVPVTKEPAGLFRTDGKRPDGDTLVPWQSDDRDIEMSLLHAHWLSLTLAEPLVRQMQQQTWLLLAKRRSMLTSVTITSLSQLP